MKNLNKYQRDMLHVALDYANRGWAVLPTSKKSKKPMIPGGSRAATTEETTIINWWSSFPSANIGVATGPISGFWVVDVDMKDGKDGLTSINKEFGDKFTFDFERDLIQKTASGGFHFFFKCEKGFVVHNKQGVLEGVDIRGDGGYIVAAPSSIHFQGKWTPYKFNNKDNEIPQAPEWANNLAKRQTAVVRKDGTLDVEKVAKGLTKGERDDGLFRFACLLRNKDIPFELAVSFVRGAARECKPPFDPDIAEAKVIDAYTRFEPSVNKQPRTMEDLRHAVKGDL